MRSLLSRLTELERRVPDLPPDVELDFLSAGPDVSGPEWENVTSTLPVDVFPLRVYKNKYTGKRVGIWAGEDDYPPGTDLRFL